MNLLSVVFNNLCYQHCFIFIKYLILSSKSLCYLLWEPNIKSKLIKPKQIKLQKISEQPFVYTKILDTTTTKSNVF